MTAAALGGRAFEPPSLSPPWLRPAAIAIVVALHAAALSIVALTPKPVEPPREVIVDIQPEAPPAEALAPPAEAPKPAEQPAAEPPPTAQAPPPQPAPPVAIAPPPPDVEQPPIPPVEPPPVAAAPPTPPPVVEAPPPPAPAAPVVEAPPPPPAPVELQRPKPPPPRIEQRPRAAPEPVRPRPETSERKPPSAAPRKMASLEAGRPEAQAPAAPAASAASQSAYISEISGEIRSRMFYPDAAKARGARGVVGVAFTIGSSGAVAAFAITRSSGDHDLDAAARSLVQGSRFPPPPAGPVHIATSFNYVPR